MSNLMRNFEAGAIHPLVVNWVNRVKRNNDGVTPSGNTVMAANRFYKNLLACNLTSSIYVCNFFAPESISASLTPLIQLVGPSIWNGNSFVSADCSVNGLQGDGTSKYIDSGIIPNTFANTASAHLVVYYTGIATTTGDIGCSDSGTAQERIFPLYPIAAGNTQSLYISNAGSVQVNADPGTNFAGYVMGSRISTGAFGNRIYRGSSTVSHAMLISNSLFTGNIPSVRTMGVFSTNEVGSFTGRSPRRLSFVSAGRGMTELDSLNYFNAIQQLRKEIGGGWY